MSLFKQVKSVFRGLFGKAAGVFPVKGNPQEELDVLNCDAPPKWFLAPRKGENGNVVEGITLDQLHEVLGQMLEVKNERIRRNREVELLVKGLPTDVTVHAPLSLRPKKN